MEKDSVMIEHHNNITGRDLKITSTNPYVPVVTLSIDGNIKLLKNLKQGFRIVFWNKYRSEIIIQPKKSNLLYDYMIDPTCRNIHWFFALSFRNGGNDPARNYFGKYYMLLLEFKDFNALIDNKPFFYQPIKNK